MSAREVGVNGILGGRSLAFMVDVLGAGGGEGEF